MVAVMMVVVLMMLLLVVVMFVELIALLNIFKLFEVAPLMTDPPPTSSTTWYNFYVCFLIKKTINKTIKTKCDT